VVGFHICLRGPSWAGAAIAIANAATDKVLFCARYGIVLEAWEWPCHHVGESYQGDRGEMIADASDSLVIDYNLSIANCPPYRPDWKAIVERYFRTTNETVLHWLPGDTLKRDFGNPDNRLNATLDIKQLTKLIIISTLEHNKYHEIKEYPMGRDMIAAGVRPIPMELWQWGIKNRVGRLREESRESLICKLLPRSTATVTQHGVKSSFGLHYITSQSAELEWFERAGTSGTWRVDMAVDPTEMGEAYLIATNGEVTPCNLLPRDERFSGLCCEELEEHFAIQGLESDLHKGVRQQGCSDRISLSESVIAEGETLTKMARELDPPKSARASLLGIRDNRSAENDSLDLEAFLQDGITPTPRTSPPSKEQPKQAVANAQPSFMDELRDKIISRCEVPK
jgi:putative transposase